VKLTLLALESSEKNERRKGVVGPGRAFEQSLPTAHDWLLPADRSVRTITLGEPERSTAGGPSKKGNAN
jgi:hypothetical protein